MSTTNATPKIEVLKVRKLADKSQGKRVKRYSPNTGQMVGLLNPETGKLQPWPSLGYMLNMPEAPKRFAVTQRKLMQWKSEGFVSVEGFRVVNAPSGPAHEPFKTPPHVFYNADAVTLNFAGQDPVRYKVIQQPGKYFVSGKKVINEEKNLSKPIVDPSNHVTLESHMDGQEAKVLWYFILEKE